MSLSDGAEWDEDPAYNFCHDCAHSLVRECMDRLQSGSTEYQPTALTVEQMAAEMGLERCSFNADRPSDCDLCSTAEEGEPVWVKMTSSYEGGCAEAEYYACERCVTRKYGREWKAPGFCAYCHQSGHDESTETCPQRKEDAQRFAEGGRRYSNPEETQSSTQEQYIEEALDQRADRPTLTPARLRQHGSSETMKRLRHAQENTQSEQ